MEPGHGKAGSSRLEGKAWRIRLQRPAQVVSIAAGAGSAQRGAEQTFVARFNRPVKPLLSRPAGVVQEADFDGLATLRMPLHATPPANFPKTTKQSSASTAPTKNRPLCRFSEPLSVYIDN